MWGPQTILSANFQVSISLLGGVSLAFWLAIFVICAYVIAKRCSHGYFLQLPNSPRTMMALMGPVIGLASGVILGLFSVGAHKIVGGRAKQR